MDSKRWDTIQRIFDEALEIAEAGRLAFVQNACGDDSELYAEVMSLLEADKNQLSLLDKDISGAIGGEPAVKMEGRRIGPYRIIRQIGLGGMGAVYLAERADGEFTQQVALKLIKRGMDTDEILNRFRHERQILARLQHPNIARLLDGGITDDGLPYFTLEYVDGEPIDVYCRNHNLSIDQKLDLFRTVCRTVRYAQENLVVHRDIKPSNIMITPEGTVKLLDFGIAKVISREGDFATDVNLTRTGIRVMTPGYASPEQVRGEAVTTASDVYSLGVVLFELLTGTSPYSLNGATQKDIERIICTTDPPKPSTVITQVDSEKDSGRISIKSREHRLRTARLKKRLSGDLDNICLMALRKEADRRYGSAGELLADIERHVSGLPVLARPASFTYRTGKFVRRHRVGVAFAVILFIIINTLVGYYTSRLTTERDRARLEAEKANQVAQFLTKLFEVSDPSESRGETITVREILERGAERIETELTDQKDIQGSMLTVMGKVYTSLGMYSRADTLLEAALDDLRKVYGPEHAEVATALDYLGQAKLYQGEFKPAEELFRQALDMRLKLLGPTHNDVAVSKNDLAWVLNEMNSFDEAERLYREALDIWDQLPPTKESPASFTMNNLALLLHERGKYEAADSLFRKALGIQRKNLGDTHPEIATTMYNLGQLLRDEGKFREAVTNNREVLAMDRRMHGEMHPDVAYSLSSLALSLQELGEFDEAEPLFREALEMRKELLGEDHPQVARSMNSLARLLHDKGDYPAAEKLYRQALKLEKTIYGENHRAIATRLNNLGWLRYDMGDYTQAESLHREALAINLGLVGEINLSSAISMMQLSRDLAARKDFIGADTLQQKALRIGRELFGEEHPFVAANLSNLARLRMMQGDLDSAEVLYRESNRMLTAILDENQPRVISSIYALGTIVHEQGRFDEAEKYYVKALNLRRQLFSESYPGIATSLVALGRLHNDRKEYAIAEPMLREGLALRERNLPPGHWKIGQAQSTLGDALRGLGRYQEAEGLLREGYKTLQATRGDDDECSQRAAKRLRVFNAENNDRSNNDNSQASKQSL